MNRVRLDTLKEGQWYWHEATEPNVLRRRAVQIAQIDISDSGISVVTTDELLERYAYRRDALVALAPDPLGPNGQERRAAAKLEMGLD